MGSRKERGIAPSIDTPSLMVHTKNIKTKYGKNI